MGETADAARLDLVLLPVLDRHGPCTLGDLYRHCEIDQVSREDVASWAESAEDRGFISSQAEAGAARRYALTDAGAAALPF